MNEQTGQHPVEPGGEEWSLLTPDSVVEHPLEKLEFLAHDVTKQVNQEQWNRIAARHVSASRWQHAARCEKNGVDPVVPEIGGQ